MIEFAAAVFFLLITPGPGVLTTAGIGSGFGYRPGLIFLAGLFIGTNLVALAAVSGLAATVFAVDGVRTALVFLSAGYLLYLAFRIAFSGSRIAFIEKQSPPGFVVGVLFQFINPKAYAVNTALFFGFAFYADSLLVETTIKFAIINAIWIPIHLLWLRMGVTLHRLNLQPGTLRAINIAMALSMLAVVGLTALSAA